MSPKPAVWVEAGLGIGSAATAWSAANKAVDQTIALNKVAVGSFRNAIGDEPYSPSGLSVGGINQGAKTVGEKFEFYV